MPSPVACPACGADGTAAANDMIARSSPPPVAPRGEPEAFIELDFARTFPHVFWISNVSHDATAPNGFRYKMFAIRREPDRIIELLLLSERTDGFKRKIFHKQAPLNKFAVADEVIRQIEKDKNVTFERFDLSEIRTLDEFRARAIEVGWETARGE